MFHKGSRLKKILENKGINVSDLAQKVGFKRAQNLQYYFNRPKIDDEILIKIFDEIGYTIDEFNGTKKIENNKLLELENKIESLQNENNQLLKDKINLLEQINELNKTTKKTIVAS